MNISSIESGIALEFVDGNWQWSLCAEERFRYKYVLGKAAANLQDLNAERIYT